MEVGGELHAPVDLPLGKEPGSGRIVGCVGSSGSYGNEKTFYSAGIRTPVYPVRILVRYIYESYS
jgi:hypothetical protein